MEEVDTELNENNHPDTNSVTFFKPGVDIKELYEFDGDNISHIISVGITRSGKSTKLRQMALRYIEYGYTVIWREVGKFDFISRFQNTQDVIDYYKSKRYKYKDKEKLIQFWQDYQEVYGDDLAVVIDHPDQIQQHKINILVFNLMDSITTEEHVIDQYHEFFRILRLDRELNWEEYDLVIICDEANDLMPTMNKIQLTRNGLKKVSEMTWWLRQWAGYHVRWVLSTHTIYQLRKDARAMCGLILFKKAEKNDSKELMQHQLFHLEDSEFLDVYKKIKSLDKSEVLYIDKENNYQFIPVPWHPKKYKVKQCRHFIEGFDVKPLIKPIKRDWTEVKRIAKLLVDNMDEKTHKKVFYMTYDEKEQKAKINLKLSQFYDYLFSFEEFKGLWGDHEFIKEYLISGVLVYYENHYGQTLVQEKVNKEEQIEQLRYRYLDGEIDLMEGFILALELNPKLSSKKLSELFNIGERGKHGSPAYKLLYKDLKHAHARDPKHQGLSLLDYYRLQKNIVIDKDTDTGDQRGKNKEKGKLKGDLVEKTNTRNRKKKKKK